MNLWCTYAGVPAVMQNVCNNQPPAKQAVLQTGQGTPLQNVKYLQRVMSLNWKQKQHPAAPFRMRTSMEIIPAFAGLFCWGFFSSCVYSLCISQHHSLFRCTMWWKSLHVLCPVFMVTCSSGLVQWGGKFQIWNWGKNKRCNVWPLHPGRCIF